MDFIPNQPIRAEHLADFAVLEGLALSSPHTVLFIAADARGVDHEVIARAADHLLKHGLVSVCVWGPDCERVHDIFDEVYIGDGSIEPSFVLMSTWHDNGSLEDAYEFFALNAMPLDFDENELSHVAVTIGDACGGIVLPSFKSDKGA